MQILLSSTQAGPGRTGKQEQKKTFSQPSTSLLADLCTLTDLIFGPGGDPILFGDELDDLGLVEQDGLVERCCAVLWIV